MPQARLTCQLQAGQSAPLGVYRNRSSPNALVEYGPAVDDTTTTILFDPQTAGDLLISLSAGKADLLVRALQALGRPRDNSGRCFTPDRSIDPGCVAHDKFRLFLRCSWIWPSSDGRRMIQGESAIQASPQLRPFLKAPSELQCAGAGAKDQE
jgi:hypothetical protein